MRPNGFCLVRVTTYDDGARFVNWIDLAPEGTPYDIHEESEAA